MPGFGDVTPEQRNAALEKARKVRAERAQIKQDLKKGKLDLLDVLDMEGDLVGKIKVTQLLESLPGTGKSGARKAMTEIGISEVRRVAGLTARQRAELEDWFCTV